MSIKTIPRSEFDRLVPQNPAKTSQKTHLRMISRNEFDKLFPNRPALESFTGDLVEWFANEANNTLGAIDHEQETGTWSYVVIKRNQEGVLLVSELNENIVSRPAAEAELFRKMEAAETMLATSL
jgi:hypothetical protein